ncbi:MAG: hypothetical protein BWK78_08600 [Thiotrichaceae bacterium IS1]|nr:MAG: hypothetical protein BWK78_08600 [Thiotrichaceae bacterium IS1]
MLDFASLSPTYVDFNFPMSIHPSIDGVGQCWTSLYSVQPTRASLGTQILQIPIQILDSV